jgi:putative inorganic carbon (hco3(-)) transporter
LLLVALVDTRERLRQFLGWLTVFVLALTALALFQYHGWINISALAPYAEAQDRIDPSGSAVVVVRLVSTGIFNDPNDLSLILIFGALASFYFFEDRRANPLNYLWIGCAATFLYAISLTYSRGGFIALMSALLTLFTARFGWRKSLILSAVVVPAALIYFGGTRQTDISVAQGTGHQRVWLWSEGLRLIRGTDALLGIGKGQYVEEVSYVAHNSFIHCYVELGLLGGTIFFAAFFSTLVALARVTSKSVRAATPHMQRLAPYLLAITVAYATGYMTLSRSYSLTTYLIFGLSTAYVTVAGLRPIMRDWRVDWRFVRRSMAGSFALFCALYLFVKITMSAS